MKLLLENWREYLKEDNNYRLTTSDEFQEKYITSPEGHLAKASFNNIDPDEIVTDINQYGAGDYWCVTDNCEEHYQENPNFVGMSYERLPPNLQIAVGPGNAFYDNESEIRSQADGFYDPEFDTYGLILFRRVGASE